MCMALKKSASSFRWDPTPSQSFERPELKGKIDGVIWSDIMGWMVIRIGKSSKKTILRCALVVLEALTHQEVNLSISWSGHAFYLNDVEIHDDLSCVGMNKNPRDRHKQQHSQHHFNSNKNRIVRTLIQRFVKSSSHSSPYIEAFLFNLCGRKYHEDASGGPSFIWKPMKTLKIASG